ncbi:hypothetical protein FS749_001592 [Ceratobasidium sp. UAMH 11750]|nr:hypothetical protein FS749_001592 [Ceratobasidium sp. UAMH 11750]
MPHNTRSKSSNSATGCNAHSNSASSSNNTPAAAMPPAPPSPQESTRAKCEHVLKVLNSLNLSFGAFVDAVSYGDASLRGSDLARKARDSFYAHDTLSSVLKNLYEPPRAPSGGGPRPVGGSKVIRAFIFETALATFKSELETFSEDYHILDKDLVDTDFISEITSDTLHRKTKKDCPQLYTILSALTNARPSEPEDDPDEDEDERRKQAAIAKNPHFVGRATWSGAFIHLVFRILFARSRQWPTA